jgi:hypothetical protein
LRYRERFADVAERHRLDADSPLAARLLQTMIWPFHAHPLGLSTEARAERSVDGENSLLVGVDIDTGCLPERARSGSPPMKLHFLIQVYDGDGNITQQRTISRQWPVSAADRRGGWEDTLSIRERFVAEAGVSYQIRVAVCVADYGLRDMAVCHFSPNVEKAVSGRSGR